MHAADIATETPGNAAPTHVLRVEGMHCAACVGRAEQALRAVAGVAEARVHLIAEQAVVTGDADGDALVRALAAIGYAAHPVRDAAAEAAARDAAKAAAQRVLARDFALAACLTLPIFMVEMGSHLFPALHHFLADNIGMARVQMVQALLTTILLALPGARFFRAGLPALWRLAPDMNALVAVGTGAAYIYSMVASFAPHWLPAGSAHVYFEAAAVIVTLILGGRYLEERAKHRASAAIRTLVDLQPECALVHGGDGFVETPIAHIMPGDVLLAQPGARIALDGVVIWGNSHVDEAMLSGEPMPVAKAVGARVTGGTVNGEGALHIRVEAVGADGVVARIIALVSAAEGARLPITALVDRITRWFVPAVFGVAALTFLLWLALAPAPALPQALVHAVAVLIVACPCAMGLATPMAVMVGAQRAAQLGILLRGGDALQRLESVRAIAFDKTGTLTLGQPTLTDLELLPEYAADAVLADVAAVEALSEHPAARAIVAAAAARSLPLPPVRDFVVRAGHGVSAMVGEGTAARHIAIGNAAQLASHGVDCTALSARAAAWAAAGKSPIFIARDGQLAGVVALGDVAKPHSADAIRRLTADGLHVAMLSGDNIATARAIGAQLGVADVTGGLMPADKLTVLERLRAEYGPVAFVGDGINDAPVLAAADVGLAMGNGTDIAMEAADGVLMAGDPMAVVRAIRLSRATMRNIRQNLFWAFAYNIALLPLAAGALYPFWGISLSPIFAAGAMALSSIFVIGNALRLNRVEGDGR
ncbi:MAG: copper-translocating P-type ATPase [Sphingomonadaceae bacterium]|nr:copper-translocating P-type ATPase [Sphingomonadaceae bacterium]